MMPKVSGWSWSPAQGRHRHAAIPIILLSAKAQSPDVKAGMEAGADDYVTKPFEPLTCRPRARPHPADHPTHRRPSVIRDTLTAALRTALTEVGVDPPAEIHLERPARREHGTVVERGDGHRQAQRPQPTRPRRVVERLAATRLPTWRGSRSRRRLPSTSTRGHLVHECCPCARRGEEGYARPDLVAVSGSTWSCVGQPHRTTAGRGGRWPFGDALCNVMARCGTS